MKEVRLDYEEHERLLETIVKQNEIIGQLLSDKEKELIFIDNNYIHDENNIRYAGNDHGINLPRIRGEDETAKALDLAFQRLLLYIKVLKKDRDGSIERVEHWKMEMNENYYVIHKDKKEELSLRKQRFIDTYCSHPRLSYYSNPWDRVQQRNTHPFG